MSAFAGKRAALEAIHSLRGAMREAVGLSHRAQAKSKENT